MIKDLLRIGSQFIGYREYAARAEEKLSEANERVDALAQKLEQSEAARKKAELAASKAKAEVDEAKVKAASVEELQRRLKDAESALDEQKTAQTVREQEIIKRLKSQKTSHMEGDRASYVEAMRSPDSSKWVEAVEDKIKSVSANDVWDIENNPEGAKTVGCKWVYNIKYDSNGNVEKYKA
nr:uncharacterized protein LOC127333931 [Lolium perenne]